MLRKSAIAGGIILTLVGLVGLAPQIFTDTNASASIVYGTFLISSEHSALYLITAALAFVASRSERWATWFFRIFGVVYGIVAIIGFNQSVAPLGFIDVNSSDDIAHMCIGLACLILGFIAGDTSKPEHA